MKDVAAELKELEQDIINLTEHIANDLILIARKVRAMQPQSPHEDNDE